MEFVLMDVRFAKGKAVPAFEYLCSDCHQLRLSYVAADTCRNCGSKNIVKGKPGTLERSQDDGVER